MDKPIDDKALCTTLQNAVDGQKAEIAELKLLVDKWRQRVDAPEDNGIEVLDNLCSQYNLGEMDLCALVCHIWNAAVISDKG